MLVNIHMDPNDLRRALSVNRDAYGEIYVENNAVPTVLAVGVWVQVVVFGTNGEAQLTVPDHTQDHIVIEQSGVYLVLVSASVLSGAGAAAIFECEARLNNGTIRLSNVHWDRQLAGGGGDVGSTSGSGLALLSPGDTVELWIQNKTNGTDLTFEDINLTVVKVGR